MNLVFNNRKVYVEDMLFSRNIVDSYITEAYYADTEVALTEEELDQLTQENYEFIEEEWQQHWIGEAEYLYEGER